MTGHELDFWSAPAPGYLARLKLLKLAQCSECSVAAWDGHGMGMGAIEYSVHLCPIARWNRPSVYARIYSRKQATLFGGRVSVFAPAAAKHNFNEGGEETRRPGPGTISSQCRDIEDKPVLVSKACTCVHVLCRRRRSGTCYEPTGPLCIGWPVSRTAAGCRGTVELKFEMGLVQPTGGKSLVENAVYHCSSSRSDPTCPGPLSTFVRYWIALGKTNQKRSRR